MQNNHKILRLVDLLNNNGEDFFNFLSASFSSPNKDVEQFLKEKAVQSVRLSTSSTYLVVPKENPLNLLGYFSLATKMLTLKKISLSKTTEKIISRFGYYDEDSDSYKIPAILIAQFGRNFNANCNSFAGTDLMSIALQQIKDILSFTSGKTVFLECEKKKDLVEFYESNGFSILDNEVLSRNKNELIQLFRLL